MLFCHYAKEKMSVIGNHKNTYNEYKSLLNLSLELFLAWRERIE